MTGDFESMQNREGKFSSRKRKTIASSAHFQRALTYFSYDSLIRLNTDVSGFCSNTEPTTSNVLQFFSLMHEIKKKRPGIILCLSL